MTQWGMICLTESSLFVCCRVPTVARLLLGSAKTRQNRVATTTMRKTIWHQMYIVPTVARLLLGSAKTPCAALVRCVGASGPSAMCFACGSTLRIVVSTF